MQRTSLALVFFAPVFLAPVFLAPVFLALGCGNELGNTLSVRHGLVSDKVPKQAFDAALQEACGPGGTIAAGVFKRSPYLQKVDENSVAILWTSELGETPSIRVTTPDGELVVELAATLDSQSNRAEFDQFATSIDGLAPETIYCYQIVSDRAWTAPTGFRTAPRFDSPIRIAVMGDLGTRTSDQFAVLDELTRVQYDLVLVAGDLAYENGTLSDHENSFFDVYSGLLDRIPFFPISGNHDYAEDGAVFREVFALFENGGPHGRERWYSFDWGSVHIVALDTEKVGAEQAAWLERDLAATDQPWILVFMHRPPFSSGSHGEHAPSVEHFVPIFERHGVDLVLAGHDHNYERTHPINGVTYVVTGSAGRGTRPVGRSSYTAYSEAVAHFSHITIAGGELVLNAIDASGGDFDTISIAH